MRHVHARGGKTGVNGGQLTRWQKWATQAAGYERRQYQRQPTDRCQRRGGQESAQSLPADIGWGTHKFRFDDWQNEMIER